MARQPATATQLVDDDRVRVTRFDFGPGAETGWHEHAHDYVVTAVTECLMMLEEPDGTTRNADISAGEAYRRSKGVRHNVINRGERAMSFVEVELK